MKKNFGCKLSELRQKIESVEQDIEELKDGVLPIEEAKRRLENTVDAAAAFIEGNARNMADGSGWPCTVSLYESSSSPEAVAFAFACRFSRAAVMEFLIGELEDYYAGAPAIRNPERMNKLKGERVSLLRQEEALICESARQGEILERRADADVGVILGI